MYICKIELLCKKSSVQYMAIVCMGIVTVIRSEDRTNIIKPFMLIYSQCR